VGHDQTERLGAQAAQAWLEDQPRHQGFTVRGFQGTREVIRKFEARPAAFDLMVTDLTMPHLGGFDLIRRVRMLRTVLPAVIMTGYGGDHKAGAFVAAGSTDRYQKRLRRRSFRRRSPPP
jgi:DNA-binding NtrC family response regulator